MFKAKQIEITHPKYAETLAEIMLKGGIVGAIWGYHLYFLACNACDPKAVRKMSMIKGRARTQVLASPGAVEEAEEFADLKKSKGLIWAARKLKMSPRQYLGFLYKKFPLAVELYANKKAPSSVTFATKGGKTIWIAGHIADRRYSKFLETVRTLRKGGKDIVFAGTSLNLKGENTLTVRELDKAIEDFGEKIDALSVHPKYRQLKKLRYSTSCSVVNFTHKRPNLIRVGCSSIATLKKYIPGIKISKDLKSTRRRYN